MARSSRFILEGVASSLARILLPVKTIGLSIASSYDIVFVISMLSYNLSSPAVALVLFTIVFIRCSRISLRMENRLDCIAERPALLSLCHEQLQHCTVV